MFLYEGVFSLLTNDDYETKLAPELVISLDEPTGISEVLLIPDTISSSFTSSFTSEVYTPVAIFNAAFSFSFYYSYSSGDPSYS